DMHTRKAILLSCGSFNPPTIAHLRMMELARDHLQSLPSPYTVIEGIFSPVSGSYVHKPLASDHHRLTMLEKAVECSEWLRADDWEQRRGKWSRSREVLHHHRQTARHRFKDSNIDCFMVCGGDLVDSFTRILPDGSSLWAIEDLKTIVEDFGIIVVKRPGSEPSKTLKKIGLSSYKCHSIEENTCPNELSSTLLRAAIAQNKSIKYCTPDGVIDYIHQSGLYKAVNGHKANEENSVINNPRI
ncbi:hypothetical protein PMAYCL1PPCAC_31229, partial [Pristionchus mayeri]